MKKYRIEIYRVRAEYDLIINVIKISSDQSIAAIRRRYEEFYPENAVKIIEVTEEQGENKK